MKLIKIDNRTYINPEKITAIYLPPYLKNGQYWLPIVLDSKVSEELHLTP